MKSHEIAETARVAGNKLYAERNFFDALVKYNESLCHAEKNTESLGLAYANRSAVYYELKLFQRCLKNVELAKTNGYPEMNFNILENRTKKCLEQIKDGNETADEKDPFDIIKLSHEKNPKLPFVANCLEMRSNNKFGRYIISNKELRVGDIITIETPYFKVLKSDSRYEACSETNKFQRCANCLKNNMMDLIPCGECSSTMYCSQECSIQAQKMYHRYECSIVDRLLKSGVLQMGLRTFFQALSIFDDSIEDLMDFCERNDNPSFSVYDFHNMDSNNTESSKNFLKALLCLTKNGNVCDSDSPATLLENHPQLFRIWEAHEKFIKNFIQRVLQIGDSNFHGICGWSLQKKDNQFPHMIGIGCYPFISLVNHSCAPNVNRIYVEGQMLLLVERPIKKGEQLFDCYKTTFFTQPKSERQAILLDEYSFNCDCIACSENFPLFQSLKSVDKKIYKIAKKGKEELSKLNKNSAEARLQNYCDLIQKHYEKGFPSMEIVLLQENILHCVSIIIKPSFTIP